ncbi:DUF2459 domain-containing protein [Spongiibacter sp. KMU-158]|uniref:DUF2459 domain-containing protein n=1 Tax=Spongiibacter pelagi TaxID=2760804 RepID=A0A927C4P4_9GAMM|nr:DUF2459 domain-containing protein [Spongiibacter pelagi]MBD2859957.1 DUF2459 domain-containing protein [Spongiibacter pelagi]
MGGLHTLCALCALCAFTCKSKTGYSKEQGHKKNKVFHWHYLIKSGYNKDILFFFFRESKVVIRKIWTEIFHRNVGLIFLVITCHGCATLPKENATYLMNPGDKFIFVNKVNRHRGIIIGWQDAKPYLPMLKDEFPHASYLELGWGGLEWYTTERNDRGGVLVLKELFYPTSSGLYVMPFSREPVDFYAKSVELSKLKVTEVSYQAILKRIGETIKLDASGKIILEKKGTSSSGNGYRIYRANGRYYLFNNCNTWINGLLKEIGY